MSKSFKNNRRRRGGRKASSSLGRALDRRSNVYGGALMQMRRDLGWLMSVVNVEDKYIDTLFNANVMSNGIGNQSLLNGCTTGNSAVTRNGQSTKAVRCELDFICNVGATTPVMCRVMLIRDRAANAATIGIASIMQAAVDGANNYTTSQYNVATIGARVVILLDMVFQLDTVQFTARRIRRTIPLNFHTRYNTGTGGGIADISENSLYLLCFSSAGATQPTFTGSVRFLFTDN